MRELFICNEQIDELVDEISEAVDDAVESYIDENFDDLAGGEDVAKTAITEVIRKWIWEEDQRNTLDST
jgi:hypothetical protein